MKRPGAVPVSYSTGAPLKKPQHGFPHPEATDWLYRPKPRGPRLSSRGWCLVNISKGLGLSFSFLFYPEQTSRAIFLLEYDIPGAPAAVINPF